MSESTKDLEGYGDDPLTDLLADLRANLAEMAGQLEAAERAVVNGTEDLRKWKSAARGFEDSCVTLRRERTVAYEERDRMSARLAEVARERDVRVRCIDIVCREMETAVSIVRERTPHLPQQVEYANAVERWALQLRGVLPPAFQPVEGNHSVPDDGDDGIHDDWQEPRP